MWILQTTNKTYTVCLYPNINKNMAISFFIIIMAGVQSRHQFHFVSIILTIDKIFSPQKDVLNSKSRSFNMIEPIIVKTTDQILYNIPKSEFSENANDCIYKSPDNDNVYKMIITLIYSCPYYQISVSHSTSFYFIAWLQTDWQHNCASQLEAI